MKEFTKEEWSALSKEEQDNHLKLVDAMQKALKDDAKKDKDLKQLTMSEFEKVIAGIIDKRLEPLTKIDHKYRMFPGIGDNKALIDDLSAEGKFVKTCKFLKALVGGDVQSLSVGEAERRTKANLNEGTAIQGGFLVPEEFKAEILRLAPKFGIVRQNARIIPMSFDIVNIPAAGLTDMSAEWVGEGGTIKSTDPNFRQVTLVAKKLASIPKMTSELLADANVPVVSYLAELIAEQFAKAEDTQGLIGVGSPFVGVMNATGVPVYSHLSGTGFETLSYQDLVKIPGVTYSSQLGNAKYFFHRTMIAHIHALITTAGAPIFPGTPGTILGRPLVSTEILPGIGSTNYQVDASTYAIYGDLRRGLLMGERGVITMKISTEGTVGGDNLFEQDMSALRVIERVTFGVALPSAFVIIRS